MVQMDNYFEDASTKNQLAEFEKANKQQGERKEEMDIEGLKTYQSYSYHQLKN